ncbi:gluzincin family metallopeptidase [Hyunsoonleella flava]|uniref:metalloprotease n=1 Tax=Hyunsoonleella flava TaxID=2527939 RepID=UPI001F1C30C7|nr:metalloprotease [Hyunsoonleella flava]
MKFSFLTYLFLLTCCIIGYGQNSIDIEADFDVDERLITISQAITYKNTSKDTLHSIYLHDWNHSYSSKKTDLAIRLADEYINRFHLANDEQRGYTEIIAILQDNDTLVYSRLKNQLDIIKVKLPKPLASNESYNINLYYVLKIPSDEFTSYGYTKENDFNLRYWYITPAIYNSEWQYYSNKNLNDLFKPKSDIKLELTYPNNYKLTSELNVIESSQNSENTTTVLRGKDRINSKLYLGKNSKFKSIKNNEIELVSDLYDNDLQVVEKVLVNDKIINYITDNLGPYPHEKLLLTEIDNANDPVYGLSALPKFLQPFPDTFEYEMRLLKVALHNYLENTLMVNPRKDHWLLDGIQIYFLIKYVEDHYPDMKFLGKLASVWGIRSFHAADLHYNDKYTLGFMSMARTNRDQPLTMQKDSLLKFNSNIANKYKAGIGLKYLDDFINHDVFEDAIKPFLTENKLEPTSSKDFEIFLKSRTDKNIDWFFEDYLNTRKKIDFKIKKVEKTEDSITLTIKNKRNNNMPIALYTLNNDSVISKYWVEDIQKQKTITLPRNDANKLVLNYNNAAPEFNLRDNWKSLKGFFFNNKPLQFRLFQDVEDPNYNQVFFMPIVEFNNIYDGLNLGAKVYNGTLLRRNFKYKIQPQYSLGSKTITGGAFASMTHYLENRNLFAITYGASYSYRSYAEDLFVSRITPSISFSFREDDDFRSNKRQLLRFRFLDFNRDKDPLNPDSSDEPNYSVFNARYIHSNDNLINFSKWYADFQLARTFSKVSFNYEFRKLFESNRQLNLRFFTGFFLENNNNIDSDYFSFALDRPTDYLFEYNYLGRSEASGIFSQQFIEAEGGFKSQLDELDVAFANQWISTANISTSIWRYILAYGDFGLVKNRFSTPKFVYDSGIRINLVTDYFEVYFPVYSNLGWEIAQPNYDQKIRFKFTVDPESLLGLFRRRWY